MSQNKSYPAQFAHCFEREGGRCFYCECEVFVYGASWPYRANMATLDHIVPRSKGGGNVRENMVLACRACNEERDLMPAEEFLRMKMLLCREAA